MQYLSTRGDDTTRGYSAILLEGLAPDGGLYWPERMPHLDSATLERWRGLGYADLAFEVMSRFIADVPADDLRDLLRKTYTAEVFGTPEIAPLHALEPGVFLQALSNGPTLAFKDMAMQWLGHNFEYELARRGQTLNVLGATSGDTGSAAEYALRGKRGVQVFMLSPAGRMSPFQQAQMYSLQDANIHNLAVEGVFDDCQDMVKAVSADLEFKQRWHIGTVNSINWARLLAQVVYYVWGYLRATSSNDERVSFAVPSGNFGNVCAGHVARSMGVPIGRLIVATNENNVLEEFFATGVYRPRSAEHTLATSSPSMDISKASNFERFVFDAVGRDPERVRRLFVDDLRDAGAFGLSASERERIPEFGFVAGASHHAQRLQTIQHTWASNGVLIDPHTADGLAVARRLRQPGETVVVLETAKPAKFAQTIHEAVGREPERPAWLAGIEALPRRFTPMGVEVPALKRFIAEHA